MHQKAQSAVAGINALYFVHFRYLQPFLDIVVLIGAHRIDPPSAATKFSS